MPTIEKRPAGPEFKDLTGRSWPLQIKLSHTTDLKKIGLKLPIHPSAEDFQKAIDFIAVDHEQLAAVLWVIIRAQAIREGVTQEVFFDALDGPTLFSAQESLVIAFAEFSQPRDVAALIRERLPKVLAEREAELIELIKSSQT